jgi:hypothetical protein
MGVRKIGDAFTGCCPVITKRIFINGLSAFLWITLVHNGNRVKPFRFVCERFFAHYQRIKGLISFYFQMDRSYKPSPQAAGQEGQRVFSSAAVTTDSAGRYYIPTTRTSVSISRNIGRLVK